MTGRLYIFLYLVLDLMSDYLVQLFANLVDLKAWKAFSMRSQVGGRCFSKQGNCSSPLTLQQTVGGKISAFFTVKPWFLTQNNTFFLIRHRQDCITVEYFWSVYTREIKLFWSLLAGWCVCCQISDFAVNT